MDWPYLLNSFHGRIGRQTFWITMLVVIVANFLACYAAEYIGGDRPSAIVDLAFTYPEFAVAVKRIYDRNLPVWLLGVFFAANAVLDLLTVLGWDSGDDKPTTLWTVIAIPFLVLLLALIIELGFRKGTTGPNQYGPDPLATS
jgi:uncharacterized membrane protein YhaH (DUF805 family)